MFTCKALHWSFVLIYIFNAVIVVDTWVSFDSNILHELTYQKVFETEFMSKVTSMFFQVSFFIICRSWRQHPTPALSVDIIKLTSRIFNMFTTTESMLNVKRRTTFTLHQQFWELKTVSYTFQRPDRLIIFRVIHSGSQRIKGIKWNFLFFSSFISSLVCISRHI